MKRSGIINNYADEEFEFSFSGLFSELTCKQSFMNSSSHKKIYGSSYLIRAPSFNGAYTKECKKEQYRNYCLTQ